MEYTQEEKKAINDLKYLLKRRYEDEIETYNLFGPIETALNLIDKQQKEINKLNNENKRIKYFSNNLFIDDYIPKEAIREKMKQLEITDCTIRYDKYDIQDILKELLGE